MTKHDAFLRDLTYKRFQQLVKELAHKEAIDCDFLESVLDRYLANAGAILDILAEVSDHREKTRLHSLLLASQEVYREMTRHFDAQQQANRRILIHEMPTDKYLGLRLQAAYLSRYVQQIDGDELAKLRQSEGWANQLRELIEQAKQQESEREESMRRSEEAARLEVTAQLSELHHLRRELESQQQELAKIAAQVGSLKSDAASVEELKGVRDLWQSYRQQSEERFRQFDEMLRAKPARLEVEEVREKLTRCEESATKTQRQQEMFKADLRSLSEQIESLSASLRTPHEDAEATMQAIISREKQELQAAVKAELAEKEQQVAGYWEQIEQEIRQLRDQLESLAVKSAAREETPCLSVEELRKEFAPLNHFHNVQTTVGVLEDDIKRLSAQNGHDPRAHERIEELLQTLAALEEQFPGLEQRIIARLPADLAPLLTQEWEKVQSERLEKWLLLSLATVKKAQDTIEAAKGKATFKETRQLLQDDGCSEGFIELVELLWHVPKPRKPWWNIWQKSVGIDK